MNARHRADVCIVGAGPAGAAAATVLARGGARVVLADRARFPREKVCGDGLLPDAVAVMDTLGVPIPASTAARIPALAMRTASGREVRFNVPGLVVRRRELDQALLHGAIASGAEFLPGHALSGIRNEQGERCIVALASAGRTVEVEADALLVATGAAPGAPRLVGLAPRFKPGAALRGYADVPGRAADALLVALLPELRRGYAWAFPGAGGVWNVGAGVFAGVQRVPPLTAVVDRFLAGLGGRWVEKPRGAPLQTSFPRTPIVRGCVALIGEAAGLARPFSGEGIGPAMRSGVIAASSLLTNRSCRVALNDFERRVKAEFAGDFGAWRFGERLLAFPGLVEAIVGRASRYPGALRRCARVLEGTLPASRVLSLWGLARLFLGR